MDEDFFSTWDEVEDEVAVNELVKDHRKLDVPALVALFTRGFPTYTERMWVHGYINAGCIVVSYLSVQTSEGRRIPGLIRSIPVGWRDLASAEAFRSRFELTVHRLADPEHGWRRREHDVHITAPWDDTDESTLREQG